MYMRYLNSKFQAFFRQKQLPLIMLCIFQISFNIIIAMINNNAIYVGISNLNHRESVHDYAESCQLYLIFSEITRIVARKNNLNVNHALPEYLSQCNKGQHVVLKSYSSFSKSILNRQCFLYNFCKIFEIENNTRNGLDYYQLFRLLCSDFPKQIVSNSVRLLQGNNTNNMSILLNSKIFLNSLYINFVYYEYLESMLQKVFQDNFQYEASIMVLYKWIKDQDTNNVKISQKPSLGLLFQLLINQICKKGFNKFKGLTFLNEDSIDNFIEQCVSNQENATISFHVLCEGLLNSKSHQKIVDENLNSFDSNSPWASEVGKLLNQKDTDIQPLNTKKMKQKK